MIHYVNPCKSPQVPYMFPTSGAWGLASNPKRRGCAERRSAALFTAAKRATSPPASRCLSRSACWMGISQQIWWDFAQKYGV